VAVGVPPEETDAGEMGALEPDASKEPGVLEEWEPLEESGKEEVAPAERASLPPIPDRPPRSSAERPKASPWSGSRDVSLTGSVKHAGQCVASG
jgi:hypothetical protein